MGAKIDDRRRVYSTVGTALTYLDDHEMLTLVGPSPATGFWGTHQVVEIAGEKVFVKRIPVTALEYENPSSTRNLFDLPLYYNYGSGRRASASGASSSRT